MNAHGRGLPDGPMSNFQMVIEDHVSHKNEADEATGINKHLTNKHNILFCRIGYLTMLPSYQQAPALATGEDAASQQPLSTTRKMYGLQSHLSLHVGLCM